MEFFLPEADERLKSGFSVDLSIVLEKAENVLYIPVSALVPAASAGLENTIHDTPVFLVYVVRDMDIERFEVETGLQAGRWVEIKSGLNEGDVVVVDPSALR
jgi:HlyD family secretion protein